MAEYPTQQQIDSEMTGDRERFTPEYFAELMPETFSDENGEPNQLARNWARQWNKRGGQSMEEVREGRMWEEEMRLESSKRWADDLPKHGEADSGDGEK